MKHYKTVWHGNGQRKEFIDGVLQPAAVIKTAIKSAAVAVRQVIKEGAKPVSPEEQERRLSICKACEFFVASQTRCEKCGCYLKWKTALEAWHCPIGRW